MKKLNVTTKTTKEEMTTYLNDNFVTVKALDVNLSERIVYTAKAYAKDAKSVTSSDLRGLVNEVNALLPNDVSEEVAVTAENSTKKTLKKADSKTESKPEEKKEDSKPADKPKSLKKNTSEKTDSKPADDKKKSSDNKVTQQDATNTQTIPLAKMFSETLKTADDNTFTIAHDIKNMTDLSTAIEKEEVIVFAFYWTERHLKQFEYFGGKLKAPKSFVNDLDIAQVIYVGDSANVAYCASMYTDAFYTILPDYLEEFEGLRLCDGVEYQIYRQIEK